MDLWFKSDESHLLGVGDSNWKQQEDQSSADTVRAVLSVPFRIESNFVTPVAGAYHDIIGAVVEQRPATGQLDSPIADFKIPPRFSPEMSVPRNFFDIPFNRCWFI
jgi:hypothetical protein